MRDAERDGNTIGVLLVRGRDAQVVEYTLHGIGTPMAVGRYTYAQLPPDVRSALPDAKTLSSGLEAAADHTRRQLDNNDANGSGGSDETP